MCSTVLGGFEPQTRRPFCFEVVEVVFGRNTVIARLVPFWDRGAEAGKE